MTREDIDDIINAICPNDEDYEKPCISPKYLRQELEQLALDQRQWNEEPTTNNGISNRSIIYKAKESKEIQEDLDKLSKLNESTANSVTLISLDVYKQVAKERDIAIEQLHELGYEFGQKIEPTTKNDLGVDAISREDALMCLTGKFEIREYEPSELISIFSKRIKALPSVSPPLSSELAKDSKKLEKKFGELDCISRADAIRVASGYCHPSNIAKELARLPSVTPKIEPRTKD